MKRVLYKFPIAGFALLSLIGCERRDIEEATPRQKRDTVMVLQYVHPSYMSGRQIWVADKQGREFYSNNVSLGPKPAVAPNPGEEIVIQHGVNEFGSYCVMVLENLSAQRLKAQYVNGGAHR